MKTTYTNSGRLRKHTTIEMDLLRLTTGKRNRRRVRRMAALRLAKAGLATVGAHDQPVRLMAVGLAAVRGLKGE